MSNPSLYYEETEAPENWGTSQKDNVRHWKISLPLLSLYIPSGWSLEVSKEKETRWLTSWISGFRFKDDHIRGQKKKEGEVRKKKKNSYKQIPAGPLFHSAWSQSQDHSMSQWSEATLWENILFPEVQSTAL